MAEAKVWNLKVKGITVTVILHVAPPYRENRLWSEEESTEQGGERLPPATHPGRNLLVDQMQLCRQPRIKLIKISTAEIVWGNLSYGNSC